MRKKSGQRCGLKVGTGTGEKVRYVTRYTLHYFFVALFPLSSVSGYNLGAALNTILRIRSTGRWVTIVPGVYPGLGNKHSPPHGIESVTYGYIAMLKYWSSLRYSFLKTLCLLAADLRHQPASWEYPSCHSSRRV